MANPETLPTKASLKNTTGAGAGDGPAAVIDRPPPGGYIVQEVSPGAKLKLNFNTSDVRVAALDVDLLLLFPDGGKIVLPGYALNMLGSAGTEAIFLDKTLLSQDLLASIADVRLTDDASMRLVGQQGETEQQATAQEKKDASEEEEKDETPPPSQPTPVATPPAPNSKFTGVADFNKPPEDAADAGLRVRRDDPLPSGSGAPPNANNNHTGDGDGNIKAAKLEITLLGVSGDVVSPRAGGGLIIRGGASVADATTNPDFAVQQQATTLNGSAQGDIIYARNPDRMPSGTYERLIDIVAELPDQGIVANSATITNLPPGFAINNARQDGDRWIIDMDALDPNHLQVELRYMLPADGTRPDVNGFLSNFVLNILFSALDSAGGIHLYSGSQTFVTRDVRTEDDVEISSTDGETTFYALNATPPGTIINAGGGDDTVYAGPGHDVIDGGTGTNTISYALSASGVTVDLAAGTGRGGYAEGDVLTNFQNVEGSAFADSLVGTSGNNTFIGSAGADTIIGNGG
ncbi:MAG: hypothetical protein LCH39_13580, partial [Proteobacteria bacterium]|nr:hypothetical protein [Pseudomonadota bacterium]